MINDFLSTTPLSQTISSTSNTQKMVTKSKIKSVQLWLSNLMYGFSCNVEILNNHHKTLLTSWNSWTPIKLILVAKNEMIGDFLSTLESSDSSFTNHLINSKYPKNGPKTQSQIGLLLALSAHIQFFMQHRGSEQPS